MDQNHGNHEFKNDLDMSLIEFIIMMLEDNKLLNS